jgi:hypothetical protein
MLASVVETSARLNVVVNEIHALGHGAPSGQQWLSYGERAIHTALMQTPWARSFTPIAPRERRTFAGLAREWAGGAERAVAARLGVTTEKQEAKNANAAA